MNGGFAKEGVDLEKAAQGNAAEMNRAFDERRHSDGAAGEEIDIALGESIRKNPVAFLKAYASHQPIIRLDSLVGNLGPELADEFKKQETEVKKRIFALKSVREPSLQPAAKACRNLSSACSVDPDAHPSRATTPPTPSRRSAAATAG